MTWNNVFYKQREKMKPLLAIAIFVFASLPGAHAQCKIALDNTDEFDSTRIIATKPMNLGYLVVSGNVPEIGRAHV